MMKDLIEIPILEDSLLSEEEKKKFCFGNFKGDSFCSGYCVLNINCIMQTKKNTILSDFSDFVLSNLNLDNIH